MAEKISCKLKNANLRSTYVVEVTSDQVIVPNQTNTSSETLTNKLKNLTPVYHSISPNASAPNHPALWFKTNKRVTSSSNGKWES